MSIYDKFEALAERLLAKYGYGVTVYGAKTPSDPVTGAGGSDGASRVVQGLQTPIDRDSFDASLVERATTGFIFSGEVLTGEFVALESRKQAVLSVRHVKPDGGTHIITKAIVGG